MLRTKYYSELFGPEPNHNVHTDNSVWNNEIPGVIGSENEVLCRPFYEKINKRGRIFNEKIKQLVQIKFQLTSIRPAGKL